ncbi:MAG: phosphatidylglycerol lysyltransferase domain-containing protein [Campylobacteraceae bacterium]|nr:phosphatidylglycerol lysyltransferase domain-containing protein [Campylobacteraceae bacterium]
MPTLQILNYELRHFNMHSKFIMEEYLKEVNVDLSDYTFAANYLWLSSASGFYTIINETFCLFIMQGSEISMLLPPLGKKELVNDAIVECFKIMNENNTSNYYSRIDYVHQNILEGFTDFLEEGTVMFEMLADYIVEKKLVDYVYKSEDLVELKGNNYHSKRNEINKFKKAYSDVRVEELEPEKHKHIINALHRKWTNDRVKYMPKEEEDRFLEGILFEQNAIKRLLLHYEELELTGICLFIGDELKGFTVGEKINDHIASIIIEKTDFEILGCAQFLFREFSKILKEKYSVEYINVGDDMGFENLKKVKMSYRPEKLIAKYTIYQK